jgi:hypothetical protein
MTRAQFLEALRRRIKATHEDLMRALYGGEDQSINVPGTKMHPFVFLRLAALAFDRASPEDQEGMRSWTAAQWRPLVLAMVAAGERVGSDVTISTARPPAPPSIPAEAPERPPAAPSAAQVAQVYPWLAPAEVEAFRAAVTTAGDYARGLGNVMAEDATRDAYEVWSGERMVTPADEVERQAQLEVIRREVGDGVAMSRDAREVASRMGEATGKWSHDWKRIAETELQGVHNEGRVRDAIGAYGAEAQVARVTETGACPDCIRLFRDAQGNPMTFPVGELIANGTNVGRKRKDWVPTIWPVHPRCRCDTIPIPPGFRVVGNGTLERNPAV